MKLFFKGIWTGMLLTYIYCTDLAMDLFPKATVLSWIMRNVLVFILVTINILLIPIASIIMITKVIRNGLRQTSEESGQYLNSVVRSDTLSDQAQKDSVEVLQNLLDKI